MAITAFRHPAILAGLARCMTMYHLTRRVQEFMVESPTPPPEKSPAVLILVDHATRVYLSCVAMILRHLSRTHNKVIGLPGDLRVTIFLSHSSMSQNSGISISRVAGGAPFLVTSVSGSSNQAIFGEPTEYKLDGSAPSEVFSTILRLLGSPDASSLSISLPVGIPEEQSRAVRGTKAFTMDHSTALINLYDHRATEPEGGALSILFVDLTPSQAAAKLSTAEVDDGEWIVTPETKTILGTEQAGQISLQDVLEQLVAPTLRGIRPHRIYILHPDGASSELSSALQVKFPGVSVKWATLADISRGAAAAITRRPTEPFKQILGADLVVLPIGVCLANEQIVTIIRRNVFLSTSKNGLFTTSRDNQTTATVQIVSGKKMVGNVVLQGLAPRPKGLARMQVTFDVDHDGKAVVTVEDMDSEAKSILNVPNIIRCTAEEAAAYHAETPNQVEPQPSEDGVLGELPE